MHVQLATKKPNHVSKKTITSQASCQKVNNINIAAIRNEEVGMHQRNM